MFNNLFVRKYWNLYKNSIFKDKKSYSKSDTLKYGLLIDDMNPIHFDTEYAKNSIFKDNIVHGMFLGSIYSSIISKNLPGSIYLKQNLNFKNPVYYDEIIFSYVELSLNQRYLKKNIIELITQSYKNKEEKITIIEGEAWIKLPKNIQYIDKIYN